MSKHPEYTIIASPGPAPKRTKWPFKTMKVGQAIDVPAEMSGAARSCALCAGFIIATETQPNGNVRVWLTGKRPPRKPQKRAKGGKA